MSAATTTHMSPLSAKARSPRSSRDRGATTPNYFNPILSPSTKPADSQPTLEAFRRQSESNSFTLGHGNLSHFSISSGSRNTSAEASPAGSRDSATLVQSPASQSTATDGGGKETQSPDAMDIDPPSPFQTSSGQQPSPFSLQLPQSSTPSFFDGAQPASSLKSPSLNRPSIRRDDISRVDEKYPRNSLPNNRIDPPSPGLGPKGLPVQRSETLPGSLSSEGSKLVSPQELCDVLDSYPTDDVLLLDVRVYPQYSQSRIEGALNLCIPTTLLKRPAFNVKKLAETFTKEKEKAKFDQWREAKVIVVYDASSSLLKDATSSVNTLKKFKAEGWHGLACIVRGGFLSFSRKSPDLIDRRPANEMENAHGRKLSIDPQRPLVAPVAGGCMMPSTQNAVNPFFGSIRQNMDLIGGVGQMQLKVPDYLRGSGNRCLPSWLKRASDENDAGKSVSDRFLQIEQGEQSRMQKALSGQVHYGSPTQLSPSAVRIAGIEKGTKNRYKDMLPYDHTRVRLQNVPAGGCDYINASHIKSFSSNRHYIASQAPVPATIEDFWRVIWEQDVHVIVMLTAEHDGGQRKSHPYWDGHYGSYSASTQRTSSLPLESSSPRITLSTTQTEIDIPTVDMREITLSRSGQSKSITQLHYSSWPDFGVPTDPAHLLSLVRICREEVRRHGQAIDDKDAYDALPIVVHCSAGCGRTGTFCAVDSVVATLEAMMQTRGQDIKGFQDDDATEDLIAHTVEDFRLQRLSMVQTLRQFVLCYETVLEWFDEGLREGLGGAREQILQDGAVRDRAVRDGLGVENRPKSMALESKLKGKRLGVARTLSQGVRSEGNYVP